MIINGFGNSGGSGYQNPYSWKPIVTWSLTNKKISEITKDSMVAISTISDRSSWDIDVLNQSLALKVVENNWSWGGSHIAATSTITMEFRIMYADSSTYSYNANWWYRRYQGTLASASTNIETIRNYQLFCWPLRPLSAVYNDGNLHKFFVFGVFQDTNLAYCNSIGISNNGEGDLYTYPRLFAKITSAASTALANTTLSCSLSLMGFVL